MKIAKEIGRSEHVVRNYLKLDQKYGLKPKTKGNQKYHQGLLGRLDMKQLGKGCQLVKLRLIWIYELLNDAFSRSIVYL